MKPSCLNYLASTLGAFTSIDLHVCGVAALLAMYEVCEIPDANIQRWKTATLCLMIPAAARLASAHYALSGNVHEKTSKNYIRALVKPSNIFWEFNEVFPTTKEKSMASFLMFIGIAFDVLLGVLGMGAIWGASQAFGLRKDTSPLFASLTVAGYCLSAVRYTLCYLNAFHKRNFTSTDRATVFQAFETGLCSITDSAYYMSHNELPSTRVHPNELKIVLLSADRITANLTSQQQAALYTGLALNLIVRGCLEVLGGTAALWGITGAADLRGEASLIDGGVVPCVGLVFSILIAFKFLSIASSKLSSHDHQNDLLLNTIAHSAAVHFDTPFVLFANAIAKINLPMQTKADNTDEARFSAVV